VVHAARVSEAASEFQSGSAGVNFDWSRPAMTNKCDQSIATDLPAAVSSCSGMRSK
jgi:hypothetical protein